MYQEAKRNKIDNNLASHRDGRSTTASHSSLASKTSQGFTGRKKLLSSYQASSLELSEMIDEQHNSASQFSSGYESNYSSSVLCSPSMKRPKSAKKSDENFYNSLNFISPVKKPIGRQLSNDKKILKEKCCSENVIRCSTPVQNKSVKRGLWGKSKSLHPGKVLTSAEFDPIKSLDIKGSFDATTSFSSFDVSDINSITQQEEDEGVNFPKSEFKQLLTGTLASVQESPEAEPKTDQKSTTPAAAVVLKSVNYCGRERIDILSKLTEKNIPLEHTVLKYLNFNDLLQLSGVSKQHRGFVHSIKSFETKRIQQTEAFKRNAENANPSKVCELLSSSNVRKEKKKKFGNFNDTTNIITEAVSPPVSPSRRRFHENQKVAQSFQGRIKKCPRCCKPARIQVMKIRKSPRKKKNLLKLTSPSRAKKTSSLYRSFHTPPKSRASRTLYNLTFQNLLEKSPSTKSDSSHSSLSSDESFGFDDSNYESIQYEYAECSGKQCSFKFCPSCNCKSHPRKECEELSMSSPPRKERSENISIACTNQSLKNLKRL